MPSKGLSGKETLHDFGERERLAGNDCFKAKRWKEAMAHYTRAIKHGSPSIDKLFSNRSITYLKLGHYSLSLSDADNCIRLNSAWGKGYFRKGEALTFLDRPEEAISAFLDGLTRDPDFMMLVRIVELLQKYQGYL
jgi:stress-induced-phosphoprotein 1